MICWRRKSLAQLLWELDARTSNPLHQPCVVGAEKLGKGFPGFFFPTDEVAQTAPWSCTSCSPLYKAWRSCPSLVKDNAGAPAYLIG